MKRFKFKETKQHRLPNHDYSSAGFYFLTFNVKNKEPYLGEIKNRIVGLSEIGCKVSEYWKEIHIHFKRVFLDEWVIMPDHFHGIIQLKDQFCGGNIFWGNTPWSVPPKNVNVVEKKQYQFNEFGKNLPHSISLIINQFKGSVKRWCNQNGHSYFFWQSRFHDVIIRNYTQLNSIRKYIQENPTNWEKIKDPFKRE